MLDNVVILQIRTSIRFGRSKDFVHQLREVLVNHFINEQFEMLFLSSLPYEIRPDI